MNPSWKKGDRVAPKSSSNGNNASNPLSKSDWLKLHEDNPTDFPYMQSKDGSCWGCGESKTPYYKCTNTKCIALAKKYGSKKTTTGSTSVTEKKVTFGSTSNDGKYEKNEKLRAKLSKGVGMVSESTDNETYVIDGQY